MLTALRAAFTRRSLIVGAAASFLFMYFEGRAVAVDIDPSSFDLFIHAGGAPETENGKKLVKQIAGRLAREGYRVRGTDYQMDTIGGPAIDYFDAQSVGAAQAVAEIVNDALKSGGQRADLKPRRQPVKNPPGFIGIWLFGNQRN